MNDRRRLEQLAIASLTEEECPDVERLAAYALGVLTGSEQLIVAAHVRGCPICTHDVAVCRPPEPRRRFSIAQLVPLALVEGRRSGADQAAVRRYEAANLVVELTVAPPDGDYWRITGQVLKAGAGLGECSVTLRGPRRRYQQTSDRYGFFTFESLPAGRYTLTVASAAVQVQIRDLVLRMDER